MTLHLFYCDETNLEERAGDFLIYGGLVIDGATAKDFSAAMDDLRTRHGVPRNYHLKFNPGPEGFTHSQFIALKQEVLELAARFNARLVVYVILHDIATNPDDARRNGINTVCYHFHCILNRLGGTGLVLIDRFNDAGNAVDAHLRDKFTIGLTGLPYSAEMRLPNIVGFHYSAIGQSHFPSIVDVALGSLRFAVNAHTRGRTGQLPSANALLGLLSPLFWRIAPEAPVPELGFLFSPKVVRAERYRTAYESLKAFLGAGGIPTAQAITDIRAY
ncbi:hypothetical protein [Roseixanthobacter liquoris]|uniref:hypothetical protein n=1 Tax=Roseixanthobacter liquoris TaxID=3119921 RepID=UPI003727136D